MQVQYHKERSHRLGRDMEFKRYGHAGRPVVMFPTSNGRFFQYEDTGTIDALADFIGAGEIQVFTLDGIDGETFFSTDPDLRKRIGRHDDYFGYVLDEILPHVMLVAQASNGGQALRPIMSGCSMGAFHSSNFAFRNPGRVAGVVALSGVYSTRGFFGEPLDGSIYFHSPLDYLRGLDDDALLAQIRADRLIFCCGRGAWEEPMLAETHQLESLLQQKHIPAWVDYWGSDASHDWPWWHRQMVYFFRHWLDADAQHRLP